MADTMTAAEIETAIDAIETQGRYITLHGLPGACPSKQDCRAFESFMRSGYAAKEKLRRMATAIKQREQEAKVCVWSEDEDGNWDTGCGNMFVLTEGAPYDNEMGFCCYCGHKLDQETQADSAMAKESGR